MTRNDDERELSVRLHREADGLDVPAGLLLRVRRTAEQHEPPVDAGKRAKWLMPVLVAAAVVAALVLFAVTPKHGVVVPAVVPPGPSSAQPSGGFVWDQLGPRQTGGTTTSSSGSSVAPDRRSPVSVVTGYLTAARAGNCADATALYWETPRDDRLRGDLCEYTISDFEVSGHEGPPASATSDVVAVTLTTDGSDDETVPAGKIVWFYQLERQPDGTWRITDGGSGP